MELYANLYDHLSDRRDTLRELYGPGSGLRDTNPIGYQQYQQEIRDLNRRLRLLRLKLNLLEQNDHQARPNNPPMA